MAEMINNINYEELAAELFVTVPFLRHHMNMVRLTLGIDGIDEIDRIDEFLELHQEECSGNYSFMCDSDGLMRFASNAQMDSLLRNSGKEKGIAPIPGTCASILYEKADVIKYKGKRYLYGPMYVFKKTKTPFSNEELLRVLLKIWQERGTEPFGRVELTTL